MLGLQILYDNFQGKKLPNIQSKRNDLLLHHRLAFTLKTFLEGKKNIYRRFVPFGTSLPVPLHRPVSQIYHYETYHWYMNLWLSAWQSPSSLLRNYFYRSTRYSFVFRIHISFSSRFSKKILSFQFFICLFPFLFLLYFVFILILRVLGRGRRCAIIDSKTRQYRFNARFFYCFPCRSIWFFCVVY